MIELSRRQGEVVALLARDLPYKVVCARLGLSMGTVCQHASRAFRRLGVDGRDDLRRVMKRTTSSKDAPSLSLWERDAA